MKVVDIKGKSNYIRFIMEDGSYIVGTGELLVNGFLCFEDTLRYVTSNDKCPGILSRENLNELESEVGRFTANEEFKVIFE